METFKVWFDRSSDTIDGVLTLQNSKGVKLINRVKARSGQKGHTASSWTRGKSPIPFGIHWLHLKPTNAGLKAGARGIGEFYPISTNGDGLTIVGKDPAQRRYEIGLHEENMWAGSAGCIVIVNPNDWQLIRQELKAIAKTGVDKIRIEVV